MPENSKGYKIKIMKDGPYLVTGGIPLSEKIITPVGKAYVYTEGRKLAQAETYLLCRCGKSSNHPFCDGAHIAAGFIGDETATNDDYDDRADLIEGPELGLLDDDRCAYARFCHTERGTTWRLTLKSDDPDAKAEAIKSASDCPNGRLVALDKNGSAFEHQYEPSIDVIQDPEYNVSGGLFVKGHIPIESSTGELYETRNRATLCRCGKSRNTPYCDASHVPYKFRDRTRKRMSNVLRRL